VAKKHLELQAKSAKVKNDRIVLGLETKVQKLREELDVSNTLAKSSVLELQDLRQECELHDIKRLTGAIEETDESLMRLRASSCPRSGTLTAHGEPHDRSSSCMCLTFVGEAVSEIDDTQATKASGLNVNADIFISAVASEIYEVQPSHLNVYADVFTPAACATEITERQFWTSRNGRESYLADLFPAFQQCFNEEGVDFFTCFGLTEFCRYISMYELDHEFWMDNLYYLETS
jgi:hypothetical protein